MTTIISARQLTRSYGRRTGIADVDLAVPEGCLFGFLGPNGAGKTTTIRILLGFLRPGSGTAAVLDRDCWRDSHRIKREIGYLPGDLRLYPWLNVERGLRFVGRVRGRDVRRAGAALAERFRLDPRVPVRKMSRGMRQKLGIVLALAHEPRILVLDEPTSGLDPLMQAELADCLRERAAQGTTVFFSSHSLAEVDQLCDRVAIVRDGRIVADEALADLRRRALRSVTIIFSTAEAAGEDAPEDLRVTRRDGDRWNAELDGPSAALVRWAATRPVADLAIGEPDLEVLFRRFYQDGSDEP